MKKILITGATGMLGATLAHMWSKKYTVFQTSSSSYPKGTSQSFFQFDLQSNSYDVLTSFVQPDCIVHCAALTSHEYCNTHPEEAMAINGESVFQLLKYFPKSKLIYISSDAVFPLHTHMATEKMKTGPVTIYGKSKVLGEKYILQTDSSKSHCIVRTTIVGKNLIPRKLSLAEWIISSLAQNKPITLYDDVLFTPISIWHFADELEWIINHSGPRVLHVAGNTVTSKYVFGKKLAQKMQLNTNQIHRGNLADQKGEDSVLRSYDQTLNSSQYELLSKRRMPALDETISELITNFHSII